MDRREKAMLKNTSIIVWGILAILLLVLGASTVQAANPATINVTVTIQYLSVSASGPIAFGTVAASSATISADSSHIVNDGNVTETYSINLTDPAGWTAVQAAPGAEEYCLSVQFNSQQPGGAAFGYTDHALTTTPTTSSASQFAGDQTGVSVAVSGERYLWFKFEAPASTAVVTEQTIVITVTASAG
jgi:hypothetical protein